MALKIMMILAEIIMALRLVSSVDKGSTADVFCNGFVMTTLCIISWVCF